MWNGLRLRKLRLARGWSQRELAQAAGTHQVTISEWETGLRIPRASMLYRLRDALGCSWSELLDDDPIHSP